MSRGICGATLASTSCRRFPKVAAGSSASRHGRQTCNIDLCAQDRLVPMTADTQSAARDSDLPSSMRCVKASAQGVACLTLLASVPHRALRVEVCLVGVVLERFEAVGSGAVRLQRPNARRSQYRGPVRRTAVLYMPPSLTVASHSCTGLPPGACAFR